MKIIRTSKISLLCLSTMLFLLLSFPMNSFTSIECTVAQKNPQLFDSPVLSGEIASDIIWNRTYGGSDFDEINCAVELSTGEFLLCGYTRSFGVSAEDMYLVKTDSDGVMIWNRTYGGSEADIGLDIVEASDGRYVISGYTYSGFYYSQAAMWITDTDGNLEWYHTYGYGEVDYGDQVIECADGGFAIGGTNGFFSGGRLGDFLLIKTNSTGHQEWINRYGEVARQERALCLCSTSDGCFVIAGFFDGTNGVASTADGRIIKVNSTGGLVWDHEYAGVHEDKFMWIIEGDNDDLIAGGFTQSYGAGGRDAWVMRINSTGGHIWNSTFGYAYEDQARSMCSDSEDGCVLAGYRDTTGGATWDGFVVRFDANGVQSWNETFGDSNIQYIWDIENIGIGEFLASGRTYSGDPNGAAWLVRFSDGNSFLTEPSDQSIELGDSFAMSLDVEEENTIDDLWLDTHLFSVDESMVITNMVQLIVGEYDVGVYIHDVLDGTLSATFTVTVEDTTDPSWIFSPTTQYVELGYDFEYQIAVSDLSEIDYWSLNDTTDFAFSFDNYYGGSTIHIVSNSALALGDYGLAVEVFDIYGNSQSDEFTVIVHDTTPPEWITPLDDYLLELGDDFECQLGASDLSGISCWWLNDTVHFECVNGIITDTAMLQVGEYGVLVAALDSSENPVYGSFNIVVEDTVVPAWVTTPSDQNLAYGEALEYQVTASDLSGIASWEIDDTVNFAISTDGLITSIVDLEQGDYSLTITVYDNSGNHLSSTITISVAGPISTTDTTTSDTTSDTGPTSGPPDDSGIMTLIIMMSIGGIAIIIIIIVLMRRKG